MILTDIMLADDITGQVSPYSPANFAELLHTMNIENVSSCKVTQTFLGQEAIMTTVTKDDVELLVKM